MERANKVYKGIASAVCDRFALTRDAFYKNKRRQGKVLSTTTKVLTFVKDRRKDQPREGGRKLYEALSNDAFSQEIKIGRDKLFEILRNHNMLVPRKRSYVKTTDSHHRFHKYKNLIKDISITKPHQVWVSDITYIRLVRGHCYLALITDVYSRKIVGFDVSDSLELSGCLRALQKALRAVPRKHALIHHSDRGAQYCSYAYTDVLKAHGVSISMTEENHCYENAIAERVNGILKDEFYLDQCFSNVHTASIACINAIKVYNNKRLHISLSYKTPNEVYENAV
jgi:transposase InsO family protein